MNCLYVLIFGQIPHQRHFLCPPHVSIQSDISRYQFTCEDTDIFTLSHAKIFIDYLASCQLYSQSVICIAVAFWTLCLKRRNYASRRVGPWSVDTMIYCFYTMYIRRSKLLLLFTSFYDTLARNQAMHSGDTRTDISRITRMHEEMFILRLRQKRVPQYRCKFTRIY